MLYQSFSDFLVLIGRTRCDVRIHCCIYAFLLPNAQLGVCFVCRVTWWIPFFSCYGSIDLSFWNLIFVNIFLLVETFLIAIQIHWHLQASHQPTLWKLSSSQLLKRFQFSKYDGSFYIVGKLLEVFLKQPCLRSVEATSFLFHGFFYNSQFAGFPIVLPNIKKRIWPPY